MVVWGQVRGSELGVESSLGVLGLGLEVQRWGNLGLCLGFRARSGLRCLGLGNRFQLQALWQTPSKLTLFDSSHVWELKCMETNLEGSSPIQTYIMYSWQHTVQELTCGAVSSQAPQDAASWLLSQVTTRELLQPQRNQRG